jgi:hypothetical protein
MTCWPVSQRVGNVKNNDPTLIEPVAASPDRARYDAGTAAGPVGPGAATSAPTPLTAPGAGRDTPGASTVCGSRLDGAAARLQQRRQHDERVHHRREQCNCGTERHHPRRKANRGHKTSSRSRGRCGTCSVPRRGASRRCRLKTRHAVHLAVRRLARSPLGQRAARSSRPVTGPAGAAELLSAAEASARSFFAKGQTRS